MNFYLIYIDESYDESHFAYSAMFVPAFEWNHYFGQLLQWRHNWFDQHQIPLDYELHATKFVGGRGEFPSNRNKTYRGDLFFEAIGRIESIDGIQVINGITTDKKKHLLLFEYILNRINRTLEAKDSYGILVCDEGNENRLTSIVRRMKKENHIPSSAYHYYWNGTSARNLPLQRIIEDPLFKTSKSSYFIQLADLLAFSLLRNERPLHGRTLPAVISAFDQLDKTLIREAFSGDKRQKGIVRV